MSFLSRLFRKAPKPSSVPAPTSRPAATAPPKPSAADRAQAAAAEEQALQAAIGAGDVQAVARLVVAGSSTRVRQAAAHAIDDPDVLRQLIRDLRGGNDKGVYKVLTTRRDAQLEQARKLEQSRADIEAASKALERHSQGAYDAAYGSELDYLERRWQAVAAQADAEQRDQARQWIERSRQTIAEHERQLAAETARQQAAALAAAEAQRQREQEAQAEAAAAAEQDRAHEEQQRTQAAEQPSGQQADQQAARQIGELIKKAHAALSDGSSLRAAGVRKSIEDKLAKAPPLPASLASQLQQLDRQIAELQDWKRFSVAPKRAELIEEMESLVGAELEPLALADQIKSLQEQWRSLSKGTGENLEADWQRFHEAAQKAYQPCSEYFAAQALVRQENLQRRDAVLAQLTAFEADHDWERPDWRAVIKTLRETKLEWHQHSAVDRKAGKQQHEAFTAVSKRLQARLDAEYARNVKQKESLIERAQALLASDDSRRAIEAVKDLQQQWKTVGPVPREADQRLWETFRQHCDGVFQKRQQESATFAAGLENNKAQAVALCEQVEQIAALEGPELLERIAALGELRTAFEALGEFPRADTRELQRRFEKGLERCDAALARQRGREAEGSWTHLFEAANHVRAYRLAVVQKLDAERIDALKEAAESYIGSVKRWPKGGLQALKQALASEGSSDLATNETALKMLCIRAEILSDVPTPAEDQSLRREYQLQRLVQNMGQGGAADETSLDSLAMEWVTAGPVDEAVYQVLVQRFRGCRERSSRGA